MRGDTVVVRAFGGEPVILKVWEYGEGVVYVCGDDNFARLDAGLDGLWPVGVPEADVFCYDGATSDPLLTSWREDPSLWGAQRLWTGAVSGHEPI